MSLRNWLPGVLCVATLVQAAPPPVEVVLATGQTPRDAGMARVGELDGGLWDEAGRVLLSGRYRPSPPSPVGRNAIWVWSGPASATELYTDGDSVPYTSGPVVGPVIPISVPRIQPRLGGYRPPANYWAFQSRVATALPLIPENQALWVDHPVGTADPTIFVVNDLEDHVDGAVRFTRPTLSDAIIREVQGGPVQIFVNGVYPTTAGGRGGAVVWRARMPFAPVISERHGVVQLVAAASGMGLGSLPGGRWPFLRLMGVLPDKNLLWEAGGTDGTSVLRGEPGAWSALLEPGMAAPPARGAVPSPATPVARIGPVALAAGGAGVIAEATYAAAAGDLSGRSALLMHDGTTLRLMAFAREIVDGTAPGTRVDGVSLGAVDAPTTSLAAVYQTITGGTRPFSTQALLLASDTGTWLLARQSDPLPEPAGVTRVVQFRFPVLAARPDGTVVFAAEVELAGGRRREVLYEVTPGLPNAYRVLLSAGDTFPVATSDGLRTATITRFNSASWRPGIFDRLLVAVDLAGDAQSAVILLGGGAETAVRLEPILDGLEGVLRLRWPATVPSILESSPSLMLPDWRPVPIEPVLAGDSREVRIPIDTPGPRFFRLR